MKRFVLLAFAIGGAAACGDNLGAGDDDDTVIDAAAIDAAAIDAAPIDAPIDAAPVRFTGTITVIEAALLGPSPFPVNTVVARGIQLGVTFTDQTTAVQPIFDTDPGELTGCKVTELTLAQLPGAAGIDEGPVQFTVNNGGAPANPTFPECSFVPGGTGYICPDPSSSQAITAATSVLLEQINTTTSRLTVVAGTATFDAADIGRYVKFSGTGTAFDASFAALPIVALGATSNVVVLGSPVPDPLTTFLTGALTTLAGVGPQPGLAAPGQLSDTGTATAALNAAAGAHYPDTAFNFPFIGDDFTMDDTNAALMRSIPTDGSPFTLSCDACGASIGTILSITTTDGSIAGLGATSMPTPATKRVSIRCAAVGPTSVTVPATVSAFIMNSGATRIQTNFVRASFGSATPGNEGLTGVIAGHGMVGFTTPTP